MNTIKLKGEQLLATELLKIIPLIEKCFKPFEGQRAKTKTGHSASFNKIMNNFKNECALVSFCSPFLDNNYSSCFIKVKVKLESDNGQGWHYFDRGVYIGEVNYETSLFTYDYIPQNTINACNAILAITEQQLINAMGKIDNLTSQIIEIQTDFPFALRELLK